MKNNKGITLIALTITIIVTIILASVATYSGVSALKDAKENRLVSEVEMVQHAVLESYTKYLMTKGEVDEKKYLVGTEIERATVQNNYLASGIELKTPTTISDNSQKYYLLNEDDLEKIGVTQSEYSYIVNYATGEVINYSFKETDSGVPLYSYSVDLR